MAQMTNNELNIITLLFIEIPPFLSCIFFYMILARVARKKFKMKFKIPSLYPFRRGKGRQWLDFF